MNPKPDKFMPALYGGIIMALISNIPVVNFINCFCCAGILLGGFLAVFFYQKNLTSGSPPLEANDCMMIGLLAGIIGAFVGSFMYLAVMAMFGNIMGELTVRLLHDLNINLPPDAWEKIEEATREQHGVGPFVFRTFFSFILDAIFGLLGGLIGYSIYKPKVVPLTPPPPPPSL